MKIAVDFFNDELISIFQGEEEIRKNCYFVELDDDFDDTKIIKKGYWKQLRNEKGKLLWDELVTFKPKMGYEIDDKDVKINFRDLLKFWTVEEILKIKYQRKLDNLKRYNSIYYEEFIDKDLNEKLIERKGALSFGKKVCFGKGTIVHNFVLNDKKIFFGCEYVEFPKIEISLNGKTYTRVKSLPFEQDFRKTDYKKIYLKLENDHFLTAYYFCFNSDKMISEKGFLQK